MHKCTNAQTIILETLLGEWWNRLWWVH